ncbi:sensor histidine kinase [Streptomyces sp. URMC 129]|uniref:sensor histidine kinase n=1 Tax=Streptomyces sp. URMC 129 TaxID=3423407 RepID=UPI003F1D0A76
MRKSIHGWLRTSAGLAAGAATAVPDILAVLAASALPGHRASGVLTRAAALERARVARLGTGRTAPGPGPGRTAGPEAFRAALGYLARRWALGVLGALVLLSVAVGAAYGSLLVWGWFLADTAGDAVTVFASAVGGWFLLFLGVHGVPAVADLEERLVRRSFGPGSQEALERRIEELAASRAGVVEAVHEERRRIERDLHDGVQQRLVAVGLLLGRARRAGRDDTRVRELLAQAHREARQAMNELRETAWRIHPTVLDEAGLHAALEAVAERSPLPVRLDYRLTAQPARTAATLAYFVVSEAVTNAVKHSGARLIHIHLTDSATRPGVIDLRVTDDGTGGADPAGSGLLGLARRARALDGTLRVDSPPGGPTTIAAELPCA